MIVRSCLGLAWLGLVACEQTEQVRRSFAVAVTSINATSVTDTGWSVTVASAEASLATARFFSGKVLLSRLRLLDLLVAPAWAHPGHYQPGEALAELLVPITVDLLAGEAAWGNATAVSGEYGSLQLAYSSAGLRVLGTGSKGDALVSFDARFAPPAPLDGIAFDELLTQEAGSVLLTFDLAVVFSRVDFAQAGAGAAPLDPTSAAFNGFARGVEDTTSYVTAWRRP